MRRIAFAAVSSLVLAACGFDDRTPSDVFFVMSGSQGSQVQVVLATQFVAGITEEGVTEVQLLASDTLVRTLPVDTVVSVVIEQRFFVEVLPLDGDSLSVRVEVDVDDRNLYDRSGLVVKAEPFRYVYLFNHPYTEKVDVVL